MTHCGAMDSGICEWCHCRRLMSWVAFQRKHIESYEFDSVKSTHSNRWTLAGRKSNLSVRIYLNYLTATAWLTVSNEQVRQKGVPFWYRRSHQAPLLVPDLQWSLAPPASSKLKPKKPTWQNEYLAWKEPDDDDRWSEKSTRTSNCFEATYQNTIGSWLRDQSDPLYHQN